MQIPLAQKSDGMYLFSSKDFDSVAELVLREYSPYMLEKAQPLDIEALADEAYSLTIIDRYLSAHGTVLGLINFHDYKMELMSLEKQLQQELIMSGTMPAQNTGLTRLKKWPNTRHGSADTGTSTSASTRCTSCSTAMNPPSSSIRGGEHSS